MTGARNDSDGRKNNRPPPAPRAISDEGLAALESMRALKVPQTKIAEHLGVDVRTVADAWHKRRAYKELK